MTLATGTAEVFPRGQLSGREFVRLVDEHNKGVIDDHAITAKLDADGGVTDTDYEAQLTALEIPYSGYTPTEAAVDVLPYPNPGQAMGEAIVADLLEQMNARVVDEAAIAAKLDADATVAFTTYGRGAGQVPHAVRNFADEDEVSAHFRTASGDVFIGTTPGGGSGDPSIYVSRDDGRTWALVHAFSSHTGVAFIFEGQREVLFAGLNDASQAVLYKSEDYGRSWEEVETDAFDTYATFGGAIAASTGRYHIGSGETLSVVWTSNDYGATWSAAVDVQDTDETEVSVFVEADDGGIIAAAGGAGQITLQRSTDGGATWSVEHTDTDYVTIRAGINNGAALIFVGEADTGIANTAFVSTDDGDTFSANAIGGTAAATFGSVAAGRSGRVYAGSDADNQLFFSDDDGANWSEVNADYFANDTQVTGAVANRRGEVLLLTLNGTDGAGVYLVPDFEPEPLTGLGETPSGAGPVLYPGAGGGIAGDLQGALVDLHNHVSEVWHSVCAELDGDGGVTDTDYEAQLATLRLSQRARTGRVVPRPRHQR